MKIDIDAIKNNELFTNKNYNTFTNEYITKVYELLYLSVNTSENIINLISSEMNIEQGKKLYLDLKNYHKAHKSLADLLNKEINSKEYLSNIDKENQIENQYRLKYLIDSVNRINNHLISGKEDGKNYSIFDLVKALIQRDLHIISGAGYGKTNIVCNISKTCLDNNIPCLLILGSSFRKNELPQTIILEQLGLYTIYTFQEFLHALNTLGFLKNFKIPIIIDGLNESNPYDKIWRTNIKNIIRDINQFENIIIITTCRERYTESIFEETNIEGIKNAIIMEGFQDKVRDAAIKKYFHKYNIIPSSWDFNKDLFKNPLLLKIFSIINENKTNIHIGLDNIYNSIESYINLIEGKVCSVNSSIDPILKQKIKSRIEEFCRILWTQKQRQISVEDFHKIIAPESETLIGSLTEKLLDEGLCFQRNLTADKETVQFTYDLVAGYSIASKVLINLISKKKDASLNLIKAGVEELLFNKETGHPLRQDILMSLLYLLPKKIGVNLFELFDNEIVNEECYNNIDYFINDTNGQTKLLQKIYKENKSSSNFKLLFAKLFEITYKKELLGLGNFTIKVLENLNQSEIDIFWTELIRKNRIDVFQMLLKIQRRYLRNKPKEQIAEQDLYLSFLSTTSSDKSIRSIATENLFLIAKRAPDEMIKLGKQVLCIKDFNAIESIIIAICGSVLALKNKVHTKNCLEFLANDFIPNFKNTNICIIDYIQTISAFAIKNFNLDYSNKIHFNKKYFDILKYNSTGSVYTPDDFDFSFYDFDKYQIAEIATNNLYNRETYTNSICKKIILNNIKSNKGYDKTLFDSIKDEFNEDPRYKYNNDRSVNLTSYFEKYLWQSYYEFVGYRVLSEELKSEDKNRFRCNYNFFDPTFPKLPNRFQIITECFFPQKGCDVQDWINSDKKDFIDSYLIHNLITNHEWLLLSANITQKGKENDTRFNLSLESFLIKTNNFPHFRNELEKSYYLENSNSFSNIFAGEINWSKFVNKYYEGHPEKHSNLIKVMSEYKWSEYTDNRFQNPNFEFLNPIISNCYNLNFNINNLSFSDDKGNIVTNIVWTEDIKLYYIKKDIFEKILSKMRLELTWFQYVEKFGELGKYENHNLKPYFKDSDRIIRYKDLI